MFPKVYCRKKIYLFQLAKVSEKFHVGLAATTNDVIDCDDNNEVIGKSEVNEVSEIVKSIENKIWINKKWNEIINKSK